MKPKRWYRGEVFTLPGSDTQYVFQGFIPEHGYVGVKLEDTHIPGIAEEHCFTEAQMNTAVRVCNFVVSGVYTEPNQLYITDVWLPADSSPDDVLKSAYTVCARDNQFGTRYDNGKDMTWEDNPDISFISIMLTRPGRAQTEVMWSRDPWQK